MTPYYNPDQRTYTVPEFAQEVGVWPETVRIWIRAGRIKAYRPGGTVGSHYRIPGSEVERIKAEKPAQP